MATMPQCPRCKTFYSGLDFCAKCRIADLEGLGCRARRLAILGLQSERYTKDIEFRDLVDQVLARSYGLGLKES